MPDAIKIRANRARLYEQLRTAHLERAHQLDPAAILYESRRYDFDERAAEGLELHRTTAIGAVALLVRSEVQELEVNEPLNVGTRLTLAALLALALRRVLGRPRVRVVAYAIGNMDPAAAFASFRGPRARIRQLLFRVISRQAWRRLDRIAYGTDAARQTYHDLFPPSPGLEETTIWALPAPRTVSDASKRPGTVVFLGALATRKGFPLVLDAWRHVTERRPEATLTILGKGQLLDLAQDRAASDPTIDLVADPPRDQIFTVLDATQVLVLPSQPTASWREQVGLPIVEGLASGCTIVTTTETGLAEWLRAHRHVVLPVPSDPLALADAILAALDSTRPTAEILADLPTVDGRLEADRWMFGTR